ncbi:MAG: hypothetical protein V3576_05070 [Candidatus Cloacimonadota bacterium]
MRRELIWLKLLALALATLLWLQSVLVSEHKAVVNLPIVLLNNPDDLSIKEQPESIPFLVQGKGIEIIKLALSDLKVSVDASQIRPGQDILSISNYTLNIPDNIDLVMVGPVGNEDIRISAETKREKRVPINLSFENEQVRQEFSRKSLQMSPEFVNIAGPSHLIDNIRSINTVELNRRHLGQASFKLELQMPSGNLSADVEEVRILVSSNQTITKVLNNVPIPEKPGMRFFPSRLTVKLSGDRQAVDSLRISSLRPELSQTPDQQGFYTVTVRVPDGITLVDVTPDKIRVSN